MTCRAAQADHYPDGQTGWAGNELAEAWLSPTKRPANHQNPDNAPEGALEFVTAHRVRVQPVPVNDPQTHLCYGQLAFREDGTCYVRMPSQMNLSHDSRAWHEGALAFQMEDGGTIPKGCCGIRVGYMAPWAVEINYRANTVLCKAGYE